MGVGRLSAAGALVVSWRRMHPNLERLLTEQSNPASEHIDTLPAADALAIINQEDQKVAPAVAAEIPRIAEAVERIVDLLGPAAGCFTSALAPAAGWASWTPPNVRRRFKCRQSCCRAS